MKFPYAEKAFVAVVLLYFTGGVLPVFFGSDYADSTESDPTRLLIPGLIYAILILFAIPRWRHIIRAAHSAKPIVAVVVLALCSAGWSQVPAFTLRRAVALTATTVFGMYFATRFTPEAQKRFLAITLAAGAILSVACCVLMPSYGVDHSLHAGDWRGVFAHKNILGRFMSFGVVFSLVSVWHRRRLTSVGLLLVCLALLILSNSKTAISITVAMLFVVGALHWLMKMKRTSSFGLALAITGGAIAGVFLSLYVYFADIIQFMGRDSTLTGRTVIWSVLLLSALKNPLLGYGFNGFWVGIQGASADVIMTSRWQEISHAHNGYLNLWLQLGLFGVVLFVWPLFFGMARSFRLLLVQKNRQIVWPFAFLIWVLLYNIFESVSLAQNDLFWMLIVSTSVTIAGCTKCVEVDVHGDAQLHDVVEVYS